MSMPKGQMLIICQIRNIQSPILSISEMNSSNSTKGSGELAELCFDCMDIFQHIGMWSARHLKNLKSRKDVTEILCLRSFLCIFSGLFDTYST